MRKHDGNTFLMTGGVMTKTGGRSQLPYGYWIHTLNPDSNLWVISRLNHPGLEFRLEAAQDHQGDLWEPTKSSHENPRATSRPYPPVSRTSCRSLTTLGVNFWSEELGRPAKTNVKAYGLTPDWMTLEKMAVLCQIEWYGDSASIIRTLKPP